MSQWTIDELRAGADAEECHDYGRNVVDVPMFSNPKFTLKVELGDADEFQMRAAFLVDDEGGTLPISIGYLGPGEGRWALRDLILAELIGRFPTRPECETQPCVSRARQPTSALGVADTWSLITHGYCHNHWKEESATYYGDGDLVPVL